MSRRTASSLLHWLLMLVMLCATAYYFVEPQNERARASQFALAVSSAGAGQWFWDVGKNELRWYARVFELQHVSKEGWQQMADNVFLWKGGDKKPPAAAWTRILHPEDAAAVMSGLQKAVMQQGTYQAVYRAVGDDKMLTTIRVNGQAYGGERYLTGLCLETTEAEAAPVRKGSTSQMVYREINLIAHVNDACRR